MDKLQKILLIALISTSAGAWLASQAFQDEMMFAMATPYSPLSVSLFAAVWTAGIGLAIAGMITALGIVDISGHGAMPVDKGTPDMNMQAPAEDQKSDNGMDM